MADERLVYLVRHGIAAERGPEYPDDAQRPLTAEGKAKMREIGAGLGQLGVEVGEILTSPLVRARQTAEILAEGWKPAPPVVDLDALAVGGRLADVFPTLSARRGAGPVALVGHMPSLGVLAAEMIGAKRELDFKKGGVACIAVEGTPMPGGGTLLWFATPRILRAAVRKR